MIVLLRTGDALLYSLTFIDDLLDIESLETKPAGIGTLLREQSSVGQVIILRSFCFACDASEINISKKASFPAFLFIAF